MRRYLSLLPVLLAASGVGQGSPAEDAAISAAQTAMEQGRYLQAATLLKPAALRPDGTIRDDFAWAMYSNAMGRMTGEPSPRPGAPTALDAGDRRDIARIQHAVPHDAIAEIVARARRTRIVILNEHHDVPRTRAFALQVARTLRPLGYSVLAAETFANKPGAAAAAGDMAKIATDGYLRRDSGWYTQDPVFADFVRQSLRLGYRPVAYEETATQRPKDVAGQIAQRERAQTDYLIARALKAYPNAKLLIYVGHSHVAEAPLERNGKRIAWMAARLKRATGIDPLTIDQVTLLPRGPATPGSVATEMAKGRSIALFDRNRPLVVGQYAGAVDLQVVHPVLPRVDGRPGWLIGMGRGPLAIPDALLPRTGDRLIQAFVAREGSDAVPVDQVLVTAGKAPPRLMVPPGPMRLTYQDASPVPPIPGNPPTGTIGP